MATKDETHFRSAKMQIASFVDADLHRQVTALAEREGRSVAQVVRRAVEREIRDAA